MTATASTARRLVIALSLLMFVPGLVEARCPTDLDTVWRLARRSASTGAVFRGLVRSVTKIPGGEVAHVEVDTVWKGRVPRRLALHNVTGGVAESGVELFDSAARNLVAGARYVIFTNQLTVAEWQMLDIVSPPSSTFATQECGIFDAESRDVKALGKGREPE